MLIFWNTYSIRSPHVFFYHPRPLFIVDHGEGRGVIQLCYVDYCDEVLYEVIESDVNASNYPEDMCYESRGLPMSFLGLVG